MSDWDRIVGEHGPAVFGAAWRVLGHPGAAEEVVQEVFRQVHRAGPREPADCWGPLLRGLAVCRALERLGERPDADAAGPATRLRRALARLPRREAVVFCLCAFEDLSCSEIAAVLRISVATAVATLDEAQGRLARLVHESAPGCPAAVPF